MNDGNNNISKNGSGCNDPTACEAICKVDSETRNDVESARFYKLLSTIFNLCELSGFHLEDRIIVKDLRTGKIWR